LLNFSQFDFNKDQGVEGMPGVRDKSDLAVQMYGRANCADGADRWRLFAMSVSWVGHLF
jgi:hypothetical protein